MADMIEITPGVQFDTIAREWRLKWSADADKKSLQSVQQTLSIFESELKTIPGMKSVQRIVCGGCLDYKVIVALDAAGIHRAYITGMNQSTSFHHSLTN